ncbi:hypothetical protein FI667_g12203, partial [Globisporangium splendens]
MATIAHCMSRVACRLTTFGVKGRARCAIPSIPHKNVPLRFLFILGSQRILAPFALSLGRIFGVLCVLLICQEGQDGAGISVHMGEAATTEQPSAKGLAVFRDPEPVKRTISKIDWHPESPQKMAACYCILNFQDPKFSSARMPANSYIWDVMNPNTPETTLKPASPLVCMRYNPKSVDQLVAGSYNGLISFFDVRKSGSTPAETSIIEHSHHDPVYDVFWISSKTGNQCCSVSTDGWMLWWDIRHLAQPTHKILLNSENKNMEHMSDALGGGGGRQAGDEENQL